MIKKAYVFTALAICLIAVGSVHADPASWSSFMDAAISGVSLDQPLATNVLDYTLSIDAAPTITLGMNTYPIIWVQAFYVVSLTGAENFTATPGAYPADWKWESKTIPGRIVGWQGQGAGERIYPGQSKQIQFASFDITDKPVVEGYHIGYVTPTGEVVTAWFKNTQQIPEPGSLSALAIGISALIGLRRRR